VCLCWSVSSSSRCTCTCRKRRRREEAASSTTEVGGVGCRLCSMHLPNLAHPGPCRPARPHLLELLGPRALLPICPHMAIRLQLGRHQHPQLPVDGQPATGRLGKRQAAWGQVGCEREEQRSACGVVMPTTHGREVLHEPSTHQHARCPSCAYASLLRMTEKKPWAAGAYPS